MQAKEYQRRLDDLTSDLEKAFVRIQQCENFRSNVEGRMVMIGCVIGGLVTAINIALRFVGGGLNK